MLTPSLVISPLGHAKSHLYRKGHPAEIRLAGCVWACQAQGLPAWKGQQEKIVKREKSGISFQEGLNPPFIFLSVVVYEMLGKNADSQKYCKETSHLQTSAQQAPNVPTEELCLVFRNILLEPCFQLAKTCPSFALTELSVGVDPKHLRLCLPGLGWQNY